MADITDVGTITWVVEELRPAGERLRNLHALLANLLATYELAHADVIGSSADDTLLDDYADQAANVLNAANITAFMGGVETIVNYLGQEAVMNALIQASIRPLRVPEPS